MDQTRRIGNEKFVMHGIDFKRVRHLQLSMRSLNDPDGRFFAIRRAAERENGLRKRIGYEEFVVNRIVSDIVHSAAELCLLPSDNTVR